MNFTVLHADLASTILADDPVIPAAAVPMVRDATALLVEARRIRDEARAGAEAAFALARAEGHAAGRTDGAAAGEAEYRRMLFDLAVRDGERTRQRHDEIVTLALEVVRRIAGEVGEGAMLAGIAERAIAAIAADHAAVVRVPPAARTEVMQRLAAYPTISVEADADLPPMDCVVETSLGRTHAALETQLAQVERAWAKVDHG